MLSWALAFFIVAIIAAIFGFTGIASGAAEIAKILFVVFVVLFLVSLVAGLLRRPQPIRKGQIMKLKIIGIAAAFALAGVAHAQTPSPSSGADRKMKNADEDRIEAEYKADKAKCDAMSGNAKDVCQKEAKGKEKVAKAELDAKKDPSPRNQRKVEEAKADAQYDVAKERCDDMKGKEKDACQKDAKAQHERAKADIKGDKAASRGASRAPAERKP